MDWDDLKPKKPKAIEVGEVLATHSIGELEARIAALTAEIERTRRELETRRATQAAAESIFKR
jgi:uncharacterized small protein (DUF1192 family)